MDRRHTRTERFYTDERARREIAAALAFGSAYPATKGCGLKAPELRLPVEPERERDVVLT